MAKKFFLAVVILISFLSVYPLLYKGFPPTHDGEYHIVRFYEFNKTLFDGNFYPRWAPDLNNGFGVPLFNYVYPLPNYLASFLHLFGFSFINAFKLNMFIAQILGSLFFFFWAKRFWGNWGALVSSSFYSFAPYHLLDIYIRGSVGEVWALALFPALLWSVTNFIKENSSKFFILSSVFLSLLIFSHNILALMFFVFFLFYIAALILNERKFRKYLFINITLVILVGIGLSAIFWLPALFEKSYVRGLEIYDYASNFPEFYQLIIPSWGSGFAGGGLQSQLSYQIGVANLLVIFLSLIILFKKSFLNRKLTLFLIGAFFVVFFLMLKISEPIWKTVPLMNFFQFPWRLLSVEIIICAFLAGAVANIWNKKIISIILIVLSVSLGIGYANFAYYHQRNDEYYVNRSNFIDGTNSPGNTFNTIWTGDLKKQKEKIIFSEGKILLNYVNSTGYMLQINSGKGGNIIVNTAYFPGWSAYIDGMKTELNIEKEGNFSFSVPQGFHKLLITFEDTFVRKLATIISFSSIFILFITARSVKIKK